MAISALTAGILGLAGGGILGSIFGGSKEKAPAPIDHYKARRDDLRGQISVYPEWVEAERKYRPIRDATFLESLQRLTGGDADTVLGLYEQSIAPSLQRSEDAARRQRALSDLSLLDNYAADTRASLLAADPEQKALSDLLLASAKEDLESGGFSERDRMDLAEDVRAAQAARGVGGGFSDAAMEGLLSSQYRQQLEDRARQAAAHAIGVRSQIGGDAGQVLLGRPVQTRYLQGVAPGLEARASQNVFNPQSQYGANIAQTNYQGALDSSIASRQNRAELLGSGLGALGSLFGAAGQAGGFGNLFGSGTT